MSINRGNAYWFLFSGGALHGICGYNAYKRIAEDYGLEKPWEKAGRPF